MRAHILILFFAIFSFCSSALSQSSSKVLLTADPDENNEYFLDEGSELGIKVGNIGLVYVTEDQELDLESESVGTFKVTYVDLTNSKIDIEFSAGFDKSPERTLLAELTLPAFNDIYTSVTAQIAMNAIQFIDINEEVILNFDNAWDGALMEYITLMQLQLSVIDIVELLRENMDDVQLETGKYAGSTLFDAMEKTSAQDIRDFLDFINDYPGKYFGQTWIFEEIYATWLTSNTPLGKTPTIADGGLGLGLKILHDFEHSNFPVVADMSEGYWGGVENDFISKGTLITRINGTSMFGKNPEEVNRITGSGEGEIIEVEFFKDGLFETMSLAILKSGEFNSDIAIEDLDLDSPNIYPVIKDSKWGFIDGEGNYLVEPKYDRISEILFKFYNGLAEFEIDGKWGYVNMLGDEIIPAQFHKVQNFSEGLAAIFESDGSYGSNILVGFIDIKGNWVSKINAEVPSLFGGIYYDGMCIMEKYEDGNFKKGYLDRSGKIAIPLKFERVEYFHNGLASVREKDKLYGVIDKSGKYIIQPQYDYISNYNNGEIIAQKDDKYFVIDENNKVLADFKDLRLNVVLGYDEEYFIAYSKDNKVGMTDHKGNLVIPAKFSSIQDLWSELMSASYDTKKGDEGNWFFIDKTGKVTIDGPFEDVGQFKEGVCWVKKGGLWGLIDLKGDWLIDPITEIRPDPFRGVLAMLNVGNFLDPSYVYVNKSGTIIYNPN